MSNPINNDLWKKNLAYKGSFANLPLKYSDLLR